MASGFFATLTAVKIDKAVTTKDKLISDIALQKEAAQARIESRHFNPKNSQRAFSEWFFERQGTWWTYLRAGHTPIHINGGDAFPAGGTLAEVVVWYDQVSDAIRAGDLDKEIEDARKRRGKGGA